MSGLLLCSSKRSREPFYLPETDTAIYSIEELCYYLYHQICLLEEDFFTDELLAFLHDELSMEFLAGRLDAMKKTGSNLYDLVMAVLLSANYYSSAELETLKEKLQLFRTLKQEERIRLTADNWLRERKYKKALEQYGILEKIKESGKSKMDDAFWSKVYYNEGVLYMKLLFYKEACSYFEKALMLSENKEIQKTAEKALALWKGDAFWPGEDWKGEHMAALTSLYEQGSLAEYEKQAGELLEVWKQEYRKEMT